MKTPILAENIPSKLSKLLNSLIGRKLERLTRYSWYSEGEAIKEYKISKEEVFSLTAGPILIYFEDGLVIGASSNPSLNSVVIWVEKNEDNDCSDELIENDNELFPIDAKNQRNFWSCLLGQSIVALNIIKRNTNNPKMTELPNEVGLFILMSNGYKFILSHGLHDNSDDFSVIQEKQINEELLHQLKNF